MTLAVLLLLGAILGVTFIAVCAYFDAMTSTCGERVSPILYLIFGYLLITVLTFAVAAALMHGTHAPALPPGAGS